MKRFLSRSGYLLVVISALLAAPCSAQQVMRFNVDVLQPTKFTLEIEDRSAAVVAAYSENQDSLAVASVALGAARYLEGANALEDGDVGAFIIPENEYKGTWDKKYLEDLMMETGRGCLVILSEIKFGNGVLERTEGSYGYSEIVVSIPGLAVLDVYDAIHDTTLYSTLVSDSVKFYIPGKFSRSSAQIQSYVDSCETQIFQKFGVLAAQKICPTWKTEMWMLFDYPTNISWHKAYMDALDFKWQEAINGWLPFTENSNAKKASLAAFNIAVACQMMGENELAAGWISYCRGKHDFKEAAQLQRYIKAKELSTP